MDPPRSPNSAIRRAHRDAAASVAQRWSMTWKLGGIGQV